jgi:hypothetical protein
VTHPQPPDPDNLDWDPQRDGAMADYATDAEDEPETVPYNPDEPDGPGDLADA